MVTNPAQHVPLTLAKYGSSGSAPIQLTGSHMTRDQRWFLFLYFSALYSSNSVSKRHICEHASDLCLG